MHKPESVQKIETQNVLWDFKIQMDHLLSARRPDLVQVKKKGTRRILDFLSRKTTQ